MLRSSIRARLATAGAATLLVAGLFAQATPILAASPAHVAPAFARTPKVAPKLISGGTIDVRKALARPAAKLPFDPAAAAAALRKLKPAAGGAVVKPNLVSSPPPDLATDSGGPAAATPVAAAGLTQATAGNAQPADPGLAIGPDEAIQADSVAFSFTDRTG
ncbi:MAG: hypothetical protein ACRDGI_05275, partial [Candidatus Limnocylindrales bacterium]